MASYVRRLDEALGETGFVVNDLQAAHPDAWRFCVNVAAGLQRAIGMTPGGMSVELFAGAYRSGFFGVHKDDQEVITFVIEGRKRFLLWPYEVLRGQPGVPEGSERKTALLDGLDYGPLRDQAIVIEGGPGDVFYWPADHWHVAESDGGLCTSIGVGLFAESTPTEMLEQATQELIEEGVFSLPDPLPPPETDGGDARALVAAARRSLHEALEHPALEQRFEEKVMRFATAFGFRLVPREGTDELEGRYFRAIAPGAVAWMVREDTLIWSVAGLVFHYPVAGGLVSLFSRLGRGETIDVPETLRDLEEEIEPGAVLHLLGVLARHHALEPCAAPAVAREPRQRSFGEATTARLTSSWL